MSNNETNLKPVRKFLKTLQDWPPVLDYAMKVAKIQDMKVKSIMLIVADAADLFKFLIPRGFLNVIVPVYREADNVWIFYNSDMEKIGKVVDNGKFLRVSGEDLMMKQEKWGTTRIVKNPVYAVTLDKVLEQFPNAVISRHEIV